MIAQAASLAYNEETRRTFIGLDNGTISVCIVDLHVNFIDTTGWKLFLILLLMHTQMRQKAGLKITACKTARDSIFAGGAGRKYQFVFECITT